MNILCYAASAFMIAVGFLLIKKYSLNFRQRWFANFMSKLSEIYNKASDGKKQKLFAPIHDIISTDLSLKSNNQIRILEIGCGSGANLKYMPKGCRLVMVDINDSFEPMLRATLAKFPTLQLERLVHGTAEDMVDVAGDSVDAVVSTCVLCSVGDVARTLDEVRRVLVTGGKLFFLEHVAAQKGTMLYIIQCVLSKLRIWPSLFCGCYLTRDLGTTIQKSGFSAVAIEPFEFKCEDKFVFKLVKPHILGTAMK